MGSGRKRRFWIGLSEVGIGVDIKVEWFGEVGGGETEENTALSGKRSPGFGI